MDFTLGEELEEVRGLAAEVLTDRAATERVRAVERSPGRVDEDLWTELAKTGLLGVALPESDGGAGLGLAALCVLLEEQGRRVAPVPVWPAAVAALAIAGYGTAAQRRDLLPAFADGSARPTLALEEFGPHDPRDPACEARPDDGAGGGTAGGADGGGTAGGADRGAPGAWRLTGVQAQVPSPAGAARRIVSARTAAGPGLFLVAAGGEGVAWEHAETTSRDLSGHLTLTGAPAQAVGEPGTGVLERTLAHARTALAALQLGVCQGALRLAAGHLTGRRQFGRPLAAFQAVQHQLADCYIEIEAIRVCLWQAVCALDGGDGPRETEAAALVAKWWAAEAGLNVVHRVQHVHGGIGVDVDYPVHRHFLWGRQIAGTLGGASAGLARLGDVLAEGVVTP
ncbi:acyl-CoA dehydrogenase family protein [Planomonospora corallina]|uniref:Acyl-CoA dehydrogenase family protein n=1 Tax=Planomonospora corallina TaxID=1806052 RepID=A0ABV8I839_9ACTN